MHINKQTIKMNIPALFLQFSLLVLAYFSPVKSMIHAILFLWAIDWVFGVWKSLNYKRRLTSYRFRKTISKITGYIVCILVTYVFEKEFMPDWFLITKIVAAYIAWTELVSIY